MGPEYLDGHAASTACRAHATSQGKLRVKCVVVWHGHPAQVHQKQQHQQQQQQQWTNRQVEVMEVATMRSLVSFSKVYWSCRNPSYPDCVVFSTLRPFTPANQVIHTACLQRQEVGLPWVCRVTSCHSHLPALTDLCVAGTQLLPTHDEACMAAISTHSARQPLGAKFSSSSQQGPPWLCGRPSTVTLCHGVASTLILALDTCMTVA